MHREGVSRTTLLILRGKCKPSWSLPFPGTSTQKQGGESKAQGRLDCRSPVRPAQPSTGPVEPSSACGAFLKALDPTWPPSHHRPEAGLHLRLNAHWGGFPHHREDRWGDFSTIYGTKGRLVNGTPLPSAKPSLSNPRWLLYMDDYHSGNSQRFTFVNPESWLPSCNSDD